MQLEVSLHRIHGEKTVSTLLKRSEQTKRSVQHDSKALSTDKSQEQDKFIVLAREWLVQSEGQSQLIARGFIVASLGNEINGVLGYNSAL